MRKIQRVMTQILACMCLLGCTISSGEAFTREITDSFSYHAESGKCLNAAGAEGYNTVNVTRSFPKDERPELGADQGVVVEDKNFECTDLTDLDFTLYVGGTAYPTLKNWNFRGALFRNTGMAFVTVENGDFRGAHVESIVAGYTTISGTVDQFTRVPESWRISGDKVNFYQ